MRREATRVLVTGGAGFIGGQLVRTLVESGHSVRVLDDLSTGTRERLAGARVELLQADVRSAPAVRRALEGAEVVFHLAGIAAAPDPDALADVTRAEEVNVGGTLNLLYGALETHPQRVVLASSGAVYGHSAAYLLHEEIEPHPTTPEGVQHLAVEHFGRLFAESHGLSTVTLRIFRAFGPGERWDHPGAGLVARWCHAVIDNHSPILHGDGNQTRDFVYLGNVIDALSAAASTEGVDGQVFNVASSEAITVARVWSLLCELAGHRRDPPPVERVAAPRWEPDHVRVAIARAARALGYTPAVRLREGLRRTVLYYLDLHRAGPNAWFTPPSEGERPAAVMGKGGWPKPARPVPPPPPPRAGRPTPPPIPALAARPAVPLRTSNSPSPPNAPAPQDAAEIELDLTDLADRIEPDDDPGHDNWTAPEWTTRRAG